MNLSETLLGLGGFYRDIEVAKESRNGSQGNVRPESVPDQTSTGIAHPAGPATPMDNRINILGVEMSSTVLVITGAALVLIYLRSSR